ncbi:hypothetical protein N7466_000667 [Penicillium verhagenii]|uniref:uncharacterized protein n=1 Tax=Penicillium verhagenii TaxID=1562060 RepID=UPI00254569D1|nr:uncharacterized protein N7466_000667 [Penicillium verhagenii]KAJ5947652.1 hypothetical protein N7466_000667 [Penicillium verhagenii]
MDSSMEYLTDLEGAQITFDAITEPPFNFPAQKWIILEKLRSSGKTGTETKKAGIRASQAVNTPPDHPDQN